jgi:hypothetical protein
MAALTSGDWTLAEISYTATGGTGGHFDHHILSNGKRVKRFTMTLATVGTYPSGGVPIPTTVANWGMKRQLDHINIYDSAQANGNVVKYSATGNVIRLFQDNATTSDGATAQSALIEMATTATAGSGGTMIIYVEATGF